MLRGVRSARGGRSGGARAPLCRRSHRTCAQGSGAALPPLALGFCRAHARLAWGSPRGHRSRPSLGATLLPLGRGPHAGRLVRGPRWTRTGLARRCSRCRPRAPRGSLALAPLGRRSRGTPARTGRQLAWVNRPDPVSAVARPLPTHSAEKIRAEGSEKLTSPCSAP